MKTSRHIIIATMLTLAAFVTMLTVSCKNKCGSTTCQNGGSCESNVCVCPTGYSGGSCQNGWSSPFIGTYTCSDANCRGISSAGQWQSVVTVDATNGGYTIDITNFDNNNVTVVATVDSAIGNISNMLISNSAGINARGSYDATTSKINLSFSVYISGSTTATCNMVMTKQL